MSGPAWPMESPQPRTPRQAAVADYVERRRQDPNWHCETDPTYSGPPLAFLLCKSDAEYERYMAQPEDVRRQLLRDGRPSDAQAVRQEAQPQPMPQPVLRAALPFGQRIRDLRRALGWTQREVAWHLGVSARTIIRYEQGRSAPLQAAPLLALRRLESTHAHLITK